MQRPERERPNRGNGFAPDRTSRSDFLTENGRLQAVAVVGFPDPKWGEVGRAWIEAAPGVTAAGVLAALDGRLARFKLPKHIEVVAALPRTASGKVDKPLLRRSVEPA